MERPAVGVYRLRQPRQARCRSRPVANNLVYTNAPHCTVHTKKPFISAGLGHSAAVLETGNLVTWGTARQLQLGHDILREKDRRSGKTESDLGLPIDMHYPKEIVSSVLQ